MNNTALLLVDPYSEFLSEGGKLWPAVMAIANEVGLVDNLRMVTAAGQRAGIRVFIVPNRRWEVGDYGTWDYAAPYQFARSKAQIVAKGNGGGEWHPAHQIITTAELVECANKGRA